MDSQYGIWFRMQPHRLWLCGLLSDLFNFELVHFHSLVVDNLNANDLFQTCSEHALTSAELPDRKASSHDIISGYMTRRLYGVLYHPLSLVSMSELHVFAFRNVMVGSHLMTLNT